MARSRSEAPRGAAGCRALALRLLARRDHGRAELAGKLQARGYDGSEVHAVLDALAARGWLDEARAIESRRKHLLARGYGPLRLRQELCARGLDPGESGMDTDWVAGARAALAKRYGCAPPGSEAEAARRLRFLVARGFTEEQASAALDRPPED